MDEAHYRIRILDMDVTDFLLRVIRSICVLIIENG